MSKAPVDTRLTRRCLLGRATASGAALAAAALGPAAATPSGDFAYGAPLAELHVPPGILTREQKAAMIRGISDVLISATRLPREQHPYLWVQIIETAVDGWGVGGQVFVPRGQLPTEKR